MKYAVYALNEDGDLYNLEFMATDKNVARFFARGLEVWRDAYIVTYKLHEPVPNTMEIE